MSKPNVTDVREIAWFLTLHAFRDTWILIKAYSWVVLFVGAGLVSAVEPKVE